MSHPRRRPVSVAHRAALAAIALSAVAVAPPAQAASVAADADSLGGAGRSEAATAGRQSPPGVTDFKNIVKLPSGCSGSVIRFEGQPDTAKAIALTNGHCIGREPDKNYGFSLNQRSTQRFNLITESGQEGASLQATTLLYATMTVTDAAFYELNLTFAELKSKHGLEGLPLSSEPTKVGDKVVVNSGYWKARYNCTVDRAVHMLEPDGPGSWWEIDARRYPHVGGCVTKPGSSGSPVVDATTGKVTSINNSGNEKEDGASGCKGKAACETDADGKRTAHPNTGYSTPTHIVYPCLTAEWKIDPYKQGCTLPGKAGEQGKVNVPKPKVVEGRR